MPTNVVYILGAGFSKPWGLPLMSEFIREAKELERSDEQFAYLKEVNTKMRDRLDKLSSRFVGGEDNIEEVLTVLEMADYFSGGTHLKDEYSQFIMGVIKHLTIDPTPSALFAPTATPQNILSRNTEGIFGGDLQEGYATFVALLFNIVLTETKESQQKKESRSFTAFQPSSENKYVVITLNYDSVLDIFAGHVNSTLNISPPKHIKFGDPDFADDISSPFLGRVPLLKLHGSVSEGKIIPPTFLKTIMSGEELPKTWKKAHEYLMDAHKIRIIGYSLPETDSYIKYLLKTAVSSSDNLQQVDVICRDQSQRGIKERYEKLIRRDRLWFSSSSTEDYLGSLTNQVNPYEHTIAFDYLEQAHEQFKT